jgi:hypothetical protein
MKLFITHLACGAGPRRLDHRPYSLSISIGLPCHLSTVNVEASSVRAALSLLAMPDDREFAAFDGGSVAGIRRSVAEKEKVVPSRGPVIGDEV